MSTFVYATDLHGNRDSYDRLFALEAQAVVLGGDLLPHTKGTLEQRLKAQRVFVRDYLGALFASRPCYWIPGNDDWAAALPLLEGKGTAIHGRAVPFLDGTWIAGCAHVPVTPFGMKDHDRYDSEGWAPRSNPQRVLFSASGAPASASMEAVRAKGTIEGDLERLAAQSDPAKTVYVTHSPPWGTALDRLYDGTPVGSRAIRAFIERRQPPMTLHGHVHESPGVDRIGATVIVNPGDSLGRLRAVRVDLRDWSVSPPG
ncbi:MAG TPA: metallophosphoesterase [Planctomycetota bacterium]|nr:metallophosphoesterase [Planctomycetota bacterium]